MSQKRNNESASHVIGTEKCSLVEWAMTLPPCYVSKFLVKADDRWAGHAVMVDVGKGDVTLDFGGTVSVGLMAVIIEVSLRSAQHALTKVGAPFLAVSLSATLLTFCGEFFVGPVLRAVHHFDHTRDVSGGVGREASGEAVDNVAPKPLIAVGARESV
jgi:hypothetical protein